jgi:predicted RNA-binding protein
LCEFRVTLDGKQIMEEVVFAQEQNGEVTVSNIVGEAKTIRGARIIEVNVLKTHLRLETV